MAKFRDFDGKFAEGILPIGGKSGDIFGFAKPDAFSKLFSCSNCTHSTHFESLIA
jgi:hypothetical protein